ncbi:MAG: hypothetical protein EOO14_13770 [Chitinophagaceae bacterium]|nr:MAG: hypothetical protein EOO14_13770 [Chitinophagaceae bacterium]
MSFHPFSIANLCLLVLSAGLLLYYLFLLRRVQQKAPAAHRSEIQKPFARFLAVYASCMVVICLLAANGFFQEITTPPRFLLVFVLLVSGVVWLVKAKTSTMRFLQAIPPALLITIQAYRLLIELVFIQYASEKIIPVEMSIHGRNYDLWIGVLALPAGFLVAQNRTLARKVGIIFNALGLLSLVNIFSIVVPSLPSSFRLYEPLYLAAYFPGILIVFLASSAVFLHILSLRQLWVRNTGRAARHFPERTTFLTSSSTPNAIR